jgi:hypothetical protein
MMSVVVLMIFDERWLLDSPVQCREVAIDPGVD